jgi:signal transduction histidine kinase
MVRTRRRFAAQVAGCQQVEALGKLTGGVAHDFNNLMTIVRQAMGLLRGQPALRASADMMMLVDEADGAAQLGGQITERLLAFARQQPMKPEIVDVAAFIDRQRLRLERSLGPSTALAVRLEHGVGAIRADPAQLMAALINLLVNARDSMDGQGVASLSVATLDNSGRLRAGLDLPVGRYVAIAVGDTGRGITPETLRQAVTPFFTTK